MSPGTVADVSIVIPTYNRLWSLPTAVQSCRDTAIRTEIIVVDDGSTDGTWEWLSAQPDVIASRQTNRGKDWAVARAMTIATGRYVKFLDSDDAIAPGTLAPQVSIADTAAADVVCAGFDMIDEAGRLVERIDYAPTDDFIAQQLGEHGGSHYSAFLFRREFVAAIPHRQEYGALDDRMFILEVALAQPRVAAMTECALLHLHHSRERLQFGGGLRHAVKHWHMLALYKRVLADLSTSGELTPRRARVAASVLWPLAHWIAYTHPGDAANVAAWIRTLAPDFTPPEPGLLGRCYRTLGFTPTERLLRLRRGMLSLVRPSTGQSAPGAPLA